MSFMFKPLAYDDIDAVNTIDMTMEESNEIAMDSKSVAQSIIEQLSPLAKKVILIDGYVGANFEGIIKSLKAVSTNKMSFVNIENCYKNEDEINKLIKDSLPENYEEDPVLLFGDLFEGSFEDFFDNLLLKKLITSLKESNETTVIFGHGSAINALREIADFTVYIDVIPKVAAIRAREGKYTNIGTHGHLPFNLLMRRNYYVDF